MDYSGLGRDGGARHACAGCADAGCRVGAVRPGEGRARVSDGGERPAGVNAPAVQGIQVGDHNVQHNSYNFYKEPTARPGVGGAGRVVVGEIPREPLAFIERQGVARLAEAAGSGRVAVVHAVTGLRGVGKTQLAAAYARDRISQGWELVAWVNGESRDTLLADLARAARAVGVADPAGDSLESARRLREHLDARTSDGLLVMDNVTDPDLVRMFLPATGRSQVVITSTDQAFTELGIPVSVAEFSRDESVAYLTARTSLDDDAGAAAVADELGDLPLALAQASTLIISQRISYGTYLDRLRTFPVAHYLSRIAPDHYPRAVGAAILLSLRAAYESGPHDLASRVMNLLALLSSAGVSRSFLHTAAGKGLLVRNAASGPGPPAEVTATAAAAVDEVLAHLAQSSLLTFSLDGSAVAAHRLTMRVVREQCVGSETMAAVSGHAVAVLRAVCEVTELDRYNGEEVTELSQHVTALAGYLSPANSAQAGMSPELVGLRLRALWLFKGGGDNPYGAIDMGHELAADCERVLGPDHPDTLASLAILGDCYRMVRQGEDAIPLFERVLVGRQRMIGPTHPDALTALTKLAEAYDKQDRPSEATHLFERLYAD
jgi:hypothetical protein